MDREIKFRAWLPKEPESEEYIVEYEMCYDLAFEDYEPINDLLNGVNNLMQYTGLKDKNGIEIYEGDIISVSNNYVLIGNCEIVWKGCGFWFKVVDFTSETYENLFVYDEAGYALKVIGNIYENPELLKRQEVKND